MSAYTSPALSRATILVIPRGGRSEEGREVGLLPLPTSRRVELAKIRAVCLVSSRPPLLTSSAVERGTRDRGRTTGDVKVIAWSTLAHNDVDPFLFTDETPSLLGVQRAATCTPRSSLTAHLTFVTVVTAVTCR